jgi:hypothetical protein
MAIFPFIECDEIVQVNDKFRISGVKSFVTKDEADISLVEIDPGDGVFIDVTGTGTNRQKCWFLDYQHSTDGDKTVAVRITTDGAPVTTSKTVIVLSEADDYLYSKDEDLVSIESDILKYVPEGKNTFKYAHREAQKQILEWLWTRGYKKTDGTRFIKTDFVDLIEVKYWSIYVTLKLIYKDLSNATDDIFYKKAKMFENDEHHWRTRSLLRIDVNGDGEVTNYEGFNMKTVGLVRE